MPSIDRTAHVRSSHVVVASRIFLPEPAAASFRLAALARSLALSGASVDVVTTKAPQGEIERGELPAGVRVRRWPVLRDSAGYVRGYVQYLSFDVPLAARLLFGRRPDVVVVEPPPTSGAVVRIVCGLRGVPYVYYAADVVSDAAESTGAPRPVVRVVRAVERFALRGSRRTVAVTPEVEARVRSLGARDVVVVRHGVDTRIFRPDVEPEPAAPMGPFALYAGNASEWHGAEIFVQAMRHVLEQVPDARLVVMGHGSMRTRLEELAAGLPDGGACVVFLPTLDPRAVSRWFRAARVALSSIRPGVGYDFAIPTKSLAAAAVGTPVLHVGPGPTGDLVREGGLGDAVEYDVQTVAEAMSRMLRQAPDDRARARSAAWVADRASSDATGAAVASSVLLAAGRAVAG